MNLGDLPIKRVGSQGQNKTYLIALKLAQFELLQEISKEVPILLFDDMFDKLDNQRASEIINLMSQNKFGQIFISDTDRVYLTELLEKAKCKYKLYFVENGDVIFEQ
jgi:DNA replication and repair protein RecF